MKARAAFSIISLTAHAAAAYDAARLSDPSVRFRKHRKFHRDLSSPATRRHQDARGRLTQSQRPRAAREGDR